MTKPSAEEKHRNRNKEFIILGITFALIAALVVAVVYTSYGDDERVLGEGNSTIPEEFLSAREEAGYIANELVALVTATERRLGEIRELGLQGSYSEGLSVIEKEIDRNGRARDVALELSFELESMANSLPKIESEPANTTASRAIFTGIELAQGMVTYTDRGHELLNLLKASYEEGELGELSRIDNLISVMNNEAARINELNTEYRTLMRQFDALSI